MNAPAVEAARFLASFLAGLPLGLVYGLLRPIRCRHWADGLFLATVVPVWVYVCFGICAGDPGPEELLALALGFWAFRGTAGRLLEPMISGIWKFFRVKLKKFFQKIEKLTKFYLHLEKNKVQ